MANEKIFKEYIDNQLINMSCYKSIAGYKIFLIEHSKLEIVKTIFPEIIKKILPDI